MGVVWGIVWETYHKGVPLLGVPENSTDMNGQFLWFSCR